jgi:hypothetical protein
LQQLNYSKPNNMEHPPAYAPNWPSTENQTPADQTVNLQEASAPPEHVVVPVAKTEESLSTSVNNAVEEWQKKSLQQLEAKKQAEKKKKKQTKSVTISTPTKRYD